MQNVTQSGTGGDQLSSVCISSRHPVADDIDVPISLVHLLHCCDVLLYAVLVFFIVVQ